MLGREEKIPFRELWAFRSIFWAAGTVNTSSETLALIRTTPALKKKKEEEIIIRANNNFNWQTQLAMWFVYSHLEYRLHQGLTLGIHPFQENLNSLMASIKNLEYNGGFACNWVSLSDHSKRNGLGKGTWFLLSFTVTSSMLIPLTIHNSFIH